MKISRVTLRELKMRLIAPFETSFGKSDERRVMLVEAEVDGAPMHRGTATGWGEVTAGRDPFYSPETTDTAWHILRDFLWPMLKGKEFGRATEIFGLLRQVRGHEMAKGGLETAVWDAEAKLKGVPLGKLLAAPGETPREEIACGVSLGIRERIEDLIAVIEKELAAGYQRIKMKIKPGKDVGVVSAVRERFPKIKLMVDANSAYTAKDTAMLKGLDAFYLMMIEQPLGWDDIYAHVELQKQIQTPICLDECIHTLEQARAAIELGACKIINLKLGRVGGHAASRQIHDLCRERGIPVWCGGMLESGIGRAHNIAMSTLPNFTLPGDVSASKRYWDEDIIEPEVEVTPQGTIRVPTAPGIGHQPRLERIERLTVRKEVLA